VSHPRPSVLYFTQAHCPVCRRMTPQVRATADRYRDRLDLVEIDVATDPGTVSAHSVRAVPTLVAIHEGAPVGRAVGAQTPAGLCVFFAGAADGTMHRLPPSKADRSLRLAAAGALAAIAYLAAQPLLLLIAVGLVVFAFWDRVPSRKR
jgi:thioredoxin 1